VGETAARRQRYAEVREDLTSWSIADEVAEHILEWVSGDIAMHYFGHHADALDALFLMAFYEKWLPLVLRDQVDAALSEGHSWNEVAAALGVSRQAAKKRFG
jgi:hypothetical protein